VSILDFTERQLETERIYAGKILSLRRDCVSLPGGGTATREVVEHPGGVTVVPLLPNGDVICVRQFRYPFGRELLEAPAGKMAPGEEPLHAARRELAEETGYAAGEWLDLGDFYPSPGFCDEVLHLFLARDLSLGQAHPDEDEFLAVEAIPLAELLERIGRGELCDGKTIAAILKTKLFLDREGRL